MGVLLEKVILVCLNIPGLRTFDIHEVWPVLYALVTVQCLFPCSFVALNWTGFQINFVAARALDSASLFVIARGAPLWFLLAILLELVRFQLRWNSHLRFLSHWTPMSCDFTLFWLQSLLYMSSWKVNSYVSVRARYIVVAAQLASLSWRQLDSSYSFPTGLLRIFQVLADNSGQLEIFLRSW